MQRSTFTIISNIFRIPCLNYLLNIHISTFWNWRSSVTVVLLMVWAISYYNHLIHCLICTYIESILVVLWYNILRWASAWVQIASSFLWLKALSHCIPKYLRTDVHHIHINWFVQFLSLCLKWVVYVFSDYSIILWFLSYLIWWSYNASLINSKIA